MLLVLWCDHFTSAGRQVLLLQFFFSNLRFFNLKALLFQMPLHVYMYAGMYIHVYVKKGTVYPSCLVSCNFRIL